MSLARRGFELVATRAFAPGAVIDWFGEPGLMCREGDQLPAALGKKLRRSLTKASACSRMSGRLR